MSRFPLANVHPDAKIGNNVIIEPFATVQADVVIDDNSWIAGGAIVWDGSRIGKNVKLFPGASVSSIPQDLKFAGEKTETHIGDNSVIREYVTISRGTTDKMKTVIGKNCLLMAYVHVAHDCIIGNNCILVNTVQVAGHVTIEDWAIIGGASALHQFVKVGAHVMLSGGSLVRKDVPPFTKAAREPLSYAGINTIGLKRRGFAKEEMHHIEDIYRILFVQGYSINKALKIIEKDLPPTAYRDQIADFIRGANRGLMKGFRATNS